MTPEFVIGFARQSIELALLISMPILGVGLAVGVVCVFYSCAWPRV